MAKKMIGKTLVILLSFFLIVVITYSFIVGTEDPRSYFSVYLPNGSTTTSYCTENPLKVYMYDLPKRFNVAMLDHRSSDDGAPVSSRNLPPWPVESGIKRQHSVEYWMMASLLDRRDGENETREAVRVSDPESAEAFFVPFFSSLSFNTHGHNMTDPDTKYDKQLQVGILEFLRKSKYWQRSSGRDHVIPLHHPNAFRFLRQEVNASIFIVADFGRYLESMSSLRKDVVAPYVHVVDSFTDDNDPDPYESRSTLLFFRGRTVRKDEGIVRAKLGKILSGYKDVRYEQSVVTRSNIIESTKGMRSSKFCLHPAGDTPSSCRLFDAIVSHCVPVIVSDKIELPFEDEIDYSRFSIFFSVKEALVPGYMITQLRQFPKEKWLEMWLLLKQVSRHYEFQHPPKKEDAVNLIWRQVKHKLPSVNLAVHRSRRLKIPDWWH